MRDVAIIGAGPAGLALARSLVRHGVDAVVVSPNLAWNATYGVWRDDVEHCDLGAPIDAVVRGSWPTVRVVGTREHFLDRSYVVFDNPMLRAGLGAGIEHIEASVANVEHSPEHSTLRLSDGGRLQVRLVVDATGSGGFLDRRQSAAGAQTAYGLVLGRVDEAMVGRIGMTDDVFTLMDWSSPPTFLYAARFSDGLVLVEETSLYAEPPHEPDELRLRLAARLGGDATGEALAVEYVNIPMGAPLPMLTTRTVGFGAAAGYVHPVTGYSVAASLRAAPRVADAIAGALSSRPPGEEQSRAAWEAVWPSALVRTRRWHDVGLAVLRSLPTTTVPKFFDAFFDLPSRLSAAYLRVDSDPALVRAAMLEVFRRVDTPTRLRLMSSPVALLRALVAR